jgi:hypothetical protein
MKMKPTQCCAKNSRDTGHLDSYTDKSRVSSCNDDVLKSFKVKKDKNIKGVSHILSVLQKMVQKITSKKRVRECSKYSVGKSVTIRVNNEGGNARVCGLNRCENTMECPRCAHTISVARAKQVDSVVQPILEKGGEAFFVTLTIPHTMNDSFRTLWKSLGKCWDSMMRQKVGKWLGKMTHEGRPLWVKAFDHTFTRNGDHIHFHCLFVIEKRISDEDFKSFKNLMFSEWLRLIEKNTGKIGDKKGLKIDRVFDAEGVAKYNNKISSVAFEIASRGTTKQTASGSYNIWEMIWAMYEAEQSGDMETFKKLYKRFKMFEKQTHKLRTISFSKAFRERIPEEDIDEMKAQQDEQSKEVLKIRTDLWKLINQRDDTANLLELYNAFTTGEEHLKPLVEAVQRVCDRYSEDSDNFDEKQMEIDWGQVSFRISKWIYYRFRPEVYHHHQTFLVE